jgi:hygromycin-B 4-O-kinase
MTDNRVKRGHERDAKAMVRRLFEHHFKTSPTRVTHRTGGLSNFVFLVKHREGDFVVRIGSSPGKINAYIKEQWAVGRAREAGVPTPEILEVGNEVIPSPYMISRRALGEAATFHESRARILREMGKYAAIVNSIQTSGFGSVFDWSNNQLSRNDTWNDFLHQELQLETRLEILKKQKMLPSATVKQLEEVLEAGTGKKMIPSLNHGDVRLKNVLVDKKGKITCLIDWEDCMSTLAPQWELSLALHDLSIDERFEFLAGYGLSEEKTREIAPLMKALNVINYAPHIAHSAEANDVTKLEMYRLRLSGALDLFSL